jgi:hypothetical protein
VCEREQLSIELVEALCRQPQPGNIGQLTVMIRPVPLY